MSGVAVSTYTGLGRTDLPDLLRSLADAGHERVELLAAPPHVDTEEPDEAVARILPVLHSTGLCVTSVVPSGVDVNLASPQKGMRSWSARQFEATVRIAAGLGAEVAVVHPGRRHPLRPPPLDVLVDHVAAGLEGVLEVAEREGVRLLVENVPTGLLDTGAECAALAARLDGRLGVCFDVANAFMVEDVTEALDALGEELELVHVSDTTRARWLHNPLGTGEVDWPAVAAAFARRGDDRPVVLETLHEGDVAAGLAADLAFWQANVSDARG